MTTVKNYNLLHFVVFCDFHYTITIGVKSKAIPEKFAKQGVSRRFKEEILNDKGIVCLPRHYVAKSAKAFISQGFHDLKKQK